MTERKGENMLREQCERAFNKAENLGDFLELYAQGQHLYTLDDSDIMRCIRWYKAKKYETDENDEKPTIASFISCETPTKIFKSRSPITENENVRKGTRITTHFLDNNDQEITVYLVDGRYCSGFSPYFQLVNSFGTINAQWIMDDIAERYDCLENDGELQSEHLARLLQAEMAIFTLVEEQQNR